MSRWDKVSSVMFVFAGLMIMGAGFIDEDIDWLSVGVGGCLASWTLWDLWLQCRTQDPTGGQDGSN